MRPTVTAIERDLRRLLNGDVEFDRITRHLYATDAGICQIEPLGVVAPRDAEDVVRLVEYAVENQVPLVARGAGSGLAGAAVGAGLQVDFTRYMDRIVEIAPDGSWARVQPGVVMGVLNRRVRSYGTFFAPNPSSENYCTLGGMIANNSSGSRSVAYGGTKDHVLGLEMALAGGEIFRASSLSRGEPELDALLRQPTRAGRAFAQLLPLLEQRADSIAAAMPRVRKNCSGYRIETVLSESAADLHKLFVGSEGTLGLITEATLRLVPLPGRRAIGMAYFPSVFAAGESVFQILDLQPTSLEIMDANFLQLVRKHYPRIDAMLPSGADTALLVEFEGAGEEELAEKLSALEALLGAGPALEVKRALDPADQQQLWAIRQAAVPILQKLPGPRRIVEFIEDVTVHPEVLATYMSTLAGILEKHGVEGVMYGHAGDGNIHTRPLLDVKDAADLRTMQLIMDEVFDFVLEIKGTPSGEHGDGLVRSPYVRKFYGDEVYGLFCQIKNAFDPHGIMNPGKKIVTEAEAGGIAGRLRYGPNYWTYEQTTKLHFPDREYETEIEKCHGCAQCKSLVATTMCPTFKATRREHASPRAKANLLRNIISGKLDPEESYTLVAVKEVEDYCLVCGMCALECPSNVNIPKLMLEAKSRYREGRRSSAVDLVLGHADWASRAGGWAPGLATRLTRQRSLRRLAQAVTGIDHRRELPPFAHESFEEALRTDGAANTPPDQLVAFFYDTYANFHDPPLGHTIDQLLKAHGPRVVYPAQKGSGIPQMLYGYAADSRRVARFNTAAVLPLVRAGALVVSGEPTASFAFKVHYGDYLRGDEVATVAAATRDLGEYLLERRSARPDSAPAPAPLPLRVAYHQPCHLKAQKVGSPSLLLLREIPELEVIDLDAGCCGMAGTFGMKSSSFDLSLSAGRPLFERVAEVNADLVLSECSTCRLQLAQCTGRQVAHPATILAHAYGC